MTEKKGQTDRVKELTDRLEAGIKEVFASGHYREYLSAVHKFHSYSYPNTGQVKRDEQGKVMKERKEISRASFKAISIFDISQTEGEPLPELAKELQGEISNYKVLMDSIRDVAPVPIRFDTWNVTKKGYYDLVTQEIVIKSGMSELQTVKTAIHETAHSILHKDKTHTKDSKTMDLRPKVSLSWYANT